MESNNFQYESEMKWENAGEGVVRQIMAYNDDLMMVKVKFETGLSVLLIHTRIRKLLMWQAACLSSRRMVRQRSSTQATESI